MRSTSARHAQVAPGPATGAPEAEARAAGPRRRRWPWLLLIAASVTLELVAGGLFGMHVATRPVHVTADISRAHTGESAGNALSVANNCCFYSGLASAPASPSCPPTAPRREEAYAEPVGQAELAGQPERARQHR